MRKLLYTFAALASMLAIAVSCQRETPLGSSPDGDLIDVSMNFTVDDGRPATKAIGDGLTANKLTFLAYDEKGNYLSALLPTNSGYENLSSRTGTVNLKVVKGMKYKFVFIASSENAKTNYFTLSDDKKTLTLSYTAIATAQKEDSDFFYHLEDDFAFSASGEAKGVTLKRPLAQLNVGSTTEDFAVATNSGIDTDALKTGYKLTAIPNALNLLDGTVSGEADITLGTATRPSETLTVSSTNYAWVSTAYVLVGEDQTTDVTLNVKMTNTQGQDLTGISRSITAVPLKRNYRTNILGNIFSIDAMFNVSVDQNFEATDGGNINVDYIAVNSVADLNTTLTTNKANTQSQTYVVTTAEATTSATTDIVIPNYTKAASLVFQLNEIADDVTSIVIRDEEVSGGEDKQYGNDITLEVPVGFDIDNITVNAPYSHVVVKQGDITTLIASTGGDTVVIANGTKVGTLTVKCGNVRIEKGGKVTSIVRDENNTDAKTYVYVEEFAGWSMLLEQRSTVLIPVVCGVEITPEDVVFPYDATKTSFENASAFKAFAVSEANKDKTILIPEGEYIFVGTSGQGSKFGMEYGGEGFDFSFIGLGNPEKVVFKAQNAVNNPAGAYHAMAFDAKEAGHKVKLANLTLERVAGGRCPLYIKHGLTVELHNVYFKKGTHSDPQAIEIDNASVYPGSIPVGEYWPNTEISAAATVNAYGCVFEEDGYVGLTANPNVTSGNVSYVYFNFDNKCINLTAEKCRANGKSSTGSNLFVNGEPLPPYTTDGQLAIKDDEGNWQIVTGYKYQKTKSANENGKALSDFIKSLENGTVLYATEGVYEMKVKGGEGNFVNKDFTLIGIGDVIIKGADDRYAFQAQSNLKDSHHAITLRSLTLIAANGWPALYARDYITFNLHNVNLQTTGSTVIEIDAGNGLKIGDEYDPDVVTTINAFGSVIESGKKIGFTVLPLSHTVNNVTNHAYFNFDAECVNMRMSKAGYSLHANHLAEDNVFVNNVAYSQLPE